MYTDINEIENEEEDNNDIESKLYYIYNIK